MPSLYFAFSHIRRTSALSFACSSSHRRRSSSSRLLRSRRASAYDANPPPWIQTVLPAAPSSSVMIRVARAGQQLAVVGDEQDRLRRLDQPLLQPPLAGHVEIVVRLVEQQHLVRVRAAAPRAPAASARRRTAFDLAPPGPLVGDADRLDGAGVPEHLDVPAAGVRPLGERARRTAAGSARRRTPSSRARRPRRAAAAAWTRCGATESSRSRTVDSSRTEPTNCRITPRPPEPMTAPVRRLRGRP